MIQINPSSPFPIVRQLQDPNDTTTRYVQAVVRNAMNGLVVLRTNLIDQGGQRFTKVIQSPADPLGSGTFYDVTTVVFDDPIYSQPSIQYGMENETVLIQQRATNFGGGYSASDVSIESIEKLIKSSISELNVKGDTKHENVDLDPVIKEIRAMGANMEHTETKDIDFSPITDSLNRVLDAIGTIPKEHKEFDISGVDSTVKSLRSDIDDVRREYSKTTQYINKHTDESVNAIEKSIQEIMPKYFDAIIKAIHSMKSVEKVEQKGNPLTKIAELL